MSPRQPPHAAFLENIAQCFEDDARETGTRLAVRGDVHTLSGDATYAEAVILDGTARRVWLGLRDRTFEASCGCAQRARGVFCAHIWALLVRAASKGYLQGLGAEDFPRPRPAIRPKEAAVISWREALSTVRTDFRGTGTSGNAETQIMYYSDPAEAIRRGTLVLRVATRRRKKNGGIGLPQLKGLSRAQVERLEDPLDQRILELLMGAEGPAYYASYLAHDYFALGEALLEQILPALCRSGRFFLWDGKDKRSLPEPCTWEEGDPWALRYALVPEEGDQACHLRAWFERGAERMDVAEPELAFAPGILLKGGRGARFTASGDFRWLHFIRRRGVVRVPASDIDSFLAQLYSMRESIPLDLPPRLKIRPVDVDPVLRLRIDATGDPLTAGLAFGYGEVVVDRADPRDRIFRPATRDLVHRRRDQERSAHELLLSLGFRAASPASYRLDPRKLPAAVAKLVPAGWRVEGEAGVYVPPGRFSLSVRSGVDWFDVEGGVDFGGEVVSFPQLLSALRSGRGYVRLGQGSVGLLPEEWLQRHGLLLAAGERSGEALRYKPSQALILDLLLASQAEARADAGFEKAREKWRTFEGVAPLDAPAGFKGELREYQRAGLGWMRFLKECGLGGILADDMGLGKTVQALAYLESRRQEAAGPSLVVVPRSLLHNWVAEAGRFAPALRILQHWGLGRAKDARGFEGADVVLTTYGTLRLDAPFLKDAAFDLVILDEAQAIKNGESATAKAARLLRGAHRLALSGTPIENHLGELWSLMEFLNPGMLGSAAVFRGALEAGGDLGGEGRTLLARALRPFILRRTKDQVAPELPPRTEQTILVEFDDAERARYDELKEHYRKSLLSGDGAAWGKSKFNVLEALLRLRQASCHPGLIDPARRGQSSPKLEALLEHLREVAAEGRKALVFSQFTTFLGIVRKALEAETISYAYLDGKTRNRAERVDHFRSDPECHVFLISLKAGGLGLNLTEAEYVFLLDPWWNPAVEAQAIDRTHRIGQTRSVFAYRLVTKGTVEEKVLDLQRSKRELADAILRADGGLLGTLTKEDLDLLLT
jgi:superfamily II DNA or RNA helicase